jgi:very-short-patch-repair endonuclease
MATENSPPLQGRGRGGGVAKDKLALQRKRATTMRNEPTEPEKRLWRALSGSKLGGFKFRRQSVVGPYIADFCCPQKALIVEIDGDTHRPDADARRDTTLAILGFKTVRFANRDVMTNIEGVLATLLAALRASPDRWATAPPHPPPPRGGRCHPNPSPEGEGLSGL